MSLKTKFYLKCVFKRNFWWFGVAVWDRILDFIFWNRIVIFKEQNFMFSVRFLIFGDEILYFWEMTDFQAVKKFCIFEVVTKFKILRFSGSDY